MASGNDKWIRSIKDNPTGKIVKDSTGSRWEWDEANDEETALRLKNLQNDELAIEQTDLVPTVGAQKKTISTDTRGPDHPDFSPPKRKKPGGRDAGGGFNPYDNSGKPVRR